MSVLAGYSRGYLAANPHVAKRLIAEGRRALQAQVAATGSYVGSSSAIGDAVRAFSGGVPEPGTAYREAWTKVTGDVGAVKSTWYTDARGRRRYSAGRRSTKGNGCLRAGVPKIPYSVVASPRRRPQVLPGGYQQGRPNGSPSPLEERNPGIRRPPGSLAEGTNDPEEGRPQQALVSDGQDSRRVYRPGYDNSWV